MTHAAQRDSLVDGAVISHHRRLSDDHTASVIDQNPASQRSTRMDLDQRKETGYL